MMGFTQAEVDAYVDAIFAEHTWPEEIQRRVKDDLRSHYDGYRLLPDAAHPLYNSTICNFYMNKLVIDDGELPTETLRFRSPTLLSAGRPMGDLAEAMPLPGFGTPPGRAKRASVLV
jgi:hypothetical protein